MSSGARKFGKFVFAVALGLSAIDLSSVVVSAATESQDGAELVAQKVENPGREVVVHLRKAVDAKEQRQTRSAAQELDAAVKLCRENYSADMYPNLALIAATYELLGDNKKSSEYYDELAAKLAPEVKEKGRDYSAGLLELSQYAIMATESIALADSIAREALRTLDAAGRGNEEAAAKACLQVATYKLLMKQDAAALTLLERARKIMPDLNKSADARNVQEQLAKAYIQSKKYADAEPLLNSLIAYEKSGGYRSTELVRYIAMLADLKSKTGGVKSGAKVFDEWDIELKKYIAMRGQLGRAYSEYYAKQGDVMKSAEWTNRAEELQNRATAGARAVNALMSHYYVLKEQHSFDRAGETAELENILRRIDDPDAKIHDFADDLKRSREAAEKGEDDSKAKGASSLKLSAEEVTTSLNQYRDKLKPTDEDGKATKLVDDIIQRFALLNWLSGKRLTAWRYDGI